MTDSKTPVVAAVSLFILAVIMYLAFPFILGSLIVAFQFMWVFILISLVILATAFVLHYIDAHPLIVVLIPATIFWIGFGWAITQYSHGSYNEKYASWVNTVNEFEGNGDSFKQRGPIDVARKQASNAMGGNAGERLVDQTTRYVADKNVYSTISKRNSFMGHYASVIEQKSALVGRNEHHRCEFSDRASLTNRGFFSHRLSRAITSHDLLLRYQGDEIYGYCDDDTPMVVIPLYKYQGFIRPMPKPAGVALYNGKSGELTFNDNSDNIPGPSYSRKVAQAQIKSTKHSDSFMDFVFDRAGLYAEEQDENMIVSSENGEPLMVSKLKNVSGSDSIVAIGVIDAKGSSDYNKLNVYQLGDDRWIPDSAIKALIKADYQDLPNWITLEIKEIIPIDNNHWVATIGNDQNILYRVIGKGNGSDLEGHEGQKTCLFKGADETPIRCGTEALKNGNGIGIKYGENDEKTEDINSSAPSDKSIKEMTNQELIESARRFLNELESRNSQQ